MKVAFQKEAFQNLHIQTQNSFPRFNSSREIFFSFSFPVPSLFRRGGSSLFENKCRFVSFWCCWSYQDHRNLIPRMFDHPPVSSWRQVQVEACGVCSHNLRYCNFWCDSLQRRTIGILDSSCIETKFKANKIRLSNYSNYAAISVHRPVLCLIAVSVLGVLQSLMSNSAKLAHLYDLVSLTNNRIHGMQSVLLTSYENNYCSKQEKDQCI